MSRVIASRVVALGAAASLGIAVLAPAAQAADPGVTANQIVLGMTAPLSGPAAPGYSEVPAGAKAYFDYVNANGGINGRKVKLVIYDDAYNPAQTKALTSKLILSDKIFALFGSLGTPTHATVVADLNRRKIPDLLVNTGGASFNNPAKYPYTFPWLPSFIVESKAMSYYLQNTPALASKKTCLFAQDGELRDNADIGFKASGQSFDTTVTYFSGQQISPFTSQITKLKTAGCEVVVFFGVASATANVLGTAAKLSYAPQWMLTSVANDPKLIGSALGAAAPALLKGALTPGSFADINDMSNPYISQMKVIADKNSLPWDYFTFSGIQNAYLAAQALKAAGPNLTRAGLVEAMNTKSKTFRLAALVPLVYSKTSHQGLTGYYMAQFDGTGYKQITPYVMLSNNSATGGAQKATFNPAPPTRKLLP